MVNEVFFDWWPAAEIRSTGIKKFDAIRMRLFGESGPLPQSPGQSALFGKLSEFLGNTGSIAMTCRSIANLIQMKLMK
jgi:hypothetical protein